MVAAFLVALMPRGVRKAIESNSNKAEDWLPPNYSESVDLQWFRDHFIGEQFALVSWSGCTLGDTEKLNQLARRLVPSQEALANAPNDSPLHQRARWYKRIRTGPDVLEQLTSPPLALDYSDAVKRIEGALVGPVRKDANGESLGDDSRVTCLIVYLSEEATSDNKTMRAAVENIVTVASEECAIAPDTVHMGGPPVDNITIDKEGEATLVRLALLSGIVGVGLSYWCFRSFKLTSIVFAVGVLSAGMSLAIVFYFGIVEVMLQGLSTPRLGTVDAILMSMPAVVYVLGLSGAIHIVNYYRDARRDSGLSGAAESAVRLGWAPCALAAFTTAVGLGSLYTSDILPIKKFGLFTAIAVMGTVGVLFTILPVFLHRFPISDDLVARQSGHHKEGHLPDWAKRLFDVVVGRYAWVCLFWFVVLGVFAYGFTRIETEVQLLKLLDEDTDLIHDYAWLENNLGNLVPMEVVLTVPPEKIRSAEEHAEEDGKQYQLTMLERLDMMREIQRGIEQLPEISRVLSVATFTPESTDSGIGGADRSADYAKNKSLEEHRDTLLAGDYLRMEHTEARTKQETGRELWRVSARVAALDKDGEGVDYGIFVEQLKQAVDPVLVAYQQRDQIVAKLHKRGKQLDGAQLCILYRTPDDKPAPGPGTQEAVLASLLKRSGIQPETLPDGKQVQALSSFNLTLLDANQDNP
ncbi:MAG: MMPL family transporter, partial [Pseudomonadales bacterium]